MKPKNVLFLCSGNYYRSRFAELLFNHLASGKALDWRATSRGLALELGMNNAGSISRHALAGLAVRDIVLEAQYRCPLALDERDLSHAHYIVAVNRNEHLPILERKYPDYVEQVDFWQVYDLDLSTPEEALGQLERNVRELIGQLTSGAPWVKQQAAANTK